MSSGNVPVNTQQIHTLISNTNEKDMIFYEYEIVNKDKERRWAKKQARKYGLCLCSRWLFMLVGNAILVALICGICAILLYVNTPNDVTVKPLGYNEACATGTSNCDTLRNLVCSSNLCTCYSNYQWNGTDCACLTNQYWDGLACLTNQGYQQPCASWLPCSTTPTLFTCDDKSGTCLCSSTSTYYYTQFYTGAVTDLYGTSGGVCQSKTGINTACTLYGVKSCMEWLNLTCSWGPVNNYLNCACYTGYYWNTVSSSCTLIGTVPGAACLGTYSSQGCSYNSSLTCSGGVCACATNYFFHTGTGVCTYKRGYQGYCQDDNWCLTSVSLKCYLRTAGTAGTACNCPNTSLYNTCDCAYNQYWDGQICTARVIASKPCPGNYACVSGLTCLYGYCLT